MSPPDLPLYLGWPFFSSIVFAIGLLWIKQANERGASAAAVTLVTNACAGIAFTPLWMAGGTLQPWPMWWQPAAVGGLYLLGQICTFLALERGDVSVAAPLLSIKVLLVAVLLTWMDGASHHWSLWTSTFLATAGITIIQRSQPAQATGRVLPSILYALLAAGSYALFDVVVQRWSRTWGTGRLLPLAFWMSGLLSCLAWPWLSRGDFSRPEVRKPLLLGGFLFAIQSLSIGASIGLYGDAARINIVYSLRGLWGVLLAWVLSRWMVTSESHYRPSVMLWRLFGALLLTLAIVLAIV
jgi:drug/metabolite transporter (DMT)-like permease